MQKSPEDDMRLIASLTVRVGAYAYMTVTGYAFLSYALAVLSILQALGVSLLLLGVPEDVAILSGVMAGLSLAGASTYTVFKRIESLAGHSVQTARSAASFTPIPLVYLIAFIVDPEAAEAAAPALWYYGLAASLLLLSHQLRGLERARSAGAHKVPLLAATLMTAGAPALALLQYGGHPGEAVAAAGGLMGVSYLAAGTYAIKKALKVAGGKGYGPAPGAEP